MADTFGDVTAIDVYSSGPSSRASSDAAYLERLRVVARWSDRSGCRGMLIYTDGRSADPWVLAQDVIAHTTTLSPLVAVQPAYMHPFAAAQKVSSVARLYGRSIDLNFVAGGFQLDLVAIGDRVEHDERYARVAEYGALVAKLLTAERVTFRGRHYEVSGLKLEPRVPQDLWPRFTVSGSSPGGRRCAAQLNAAAVMYPEPLPANPDAGRRLFGEDVPPELRLGVRVGMLARDTAGEAWDEAIARFPDDPRGRAIQENALQVSDSSWLHRLSELAGDHDTPGESVYWLGPFRNSRSFCPYLVGSYDDVAGYVSAYLQAGVRTLILDCPREERDLTDAWHVLRRAVARSAVSVGA